MKTLILAVLSACLPLSASAGWGQLKFVGTSNGDPLNITFTAGLCDPDECAVSVEWSLNGAIETSTAKLPRELLEGIPNADDFIADCPSIPGAVAGKLKVGAEEFDSCQVSDAGIEVTFIQYAFPIGRYAGLMSETPLCDGIFATEPAYCASTAPVDVSLAEITPL